MKEQWKDVVGYEGLYEVSDLGRVRNAKNGMIRKLYIRDGEYPSVGLSKEGKRKTRRVHQLVAIGFLGHTPSGHSVHVDHIDNNKLNNNINNLQLLTCRENNSKDKSGGTSKYVGVYWNKKSSKWHTQIQHSGSMHHLGYYTDEEEARDVYVKALARIQSGLPPKSVLVKNRLS